MKAAEVEVVHQIKNNVEQARHFADIGKSRMVKNNRKTTKGRVRQSIPIKVGKWPYFEVIYKQIIHIN